MFFLVRGSVAPVRGLEFGTIDYHFQCHDFDVCEGNSLASLATTRAALESRVAWQASAGVLFST